MSSSQFNTVLLEISNELIAEQLTQMKFLCKNVIAKGRMEKIDNGITLFQVLMERRELGADKTQFLIDLLDKVHRQDLSAKLNAYESHAAVGCTVNQPDETEIAKLNIATTVITENLGKSWRKLGRKLGLTEVKLESISKRHPTDLEETVVELLKEWRKIQGAAAQAKLLIEALRDCQYNLTADKVEEKLRAAGH